MKATVRALALNFVNEVPTGTPDGTIVAFTLSQTPYSAGALIVFVDGLAQTPANYTLSGTTVTFTTAPAASSDVFMQYLRNN